MRTHWVQARARQGRTRSDLTRRALIGFRGQWRGSCHGHKRRTSQSPLSCLLPPLLPSLSSSSFSLSFHPFLQSFLLFLLLSFIGLSCKCSCWPPILVVLRSLPKSNKHSWSSSPSLSVCVHRGELVVDLSFLSLSLPQIPRVSYTWKSTMAPNFGLPTPWRFLSSPSRLAGFVCCSRWVAFFAWFFFPVQRFLQSPAFPCCLKPHPPFPVSCSLSLSIYLCLLLSLCPLARRLVRLVFLVLSTCFVADQRKNFFFPLSFRSLRFACLVLFFFHSTCTRGLLRCSWRSTPPSCLWCGPWESERCCEPCACAWRIWRGWSALRSFQYPGTALHSSWHSNASSRHIAVDRRCGAAGGPFFSSLSFSSSSPSLPSPYPVPPWSSTLLMREGVMCAVSVSC